VEQVSFKGNLHQVLREFYRPQPPPAPPQGWWQWIRGGFRRPHTPPRVRYALDEVRMNPDRVQLTLSFLEWLQIDLNPDKEMQLDLDFRSSQQSVFLQPPQAGQRDQRFSQEWLRLRCCLSDGRKLLIRVVRLTRKKVKAKRKAPKVQIRQVDRVHLALRPHPERFVSRQAPPDFQPALEPPRDRVLVTSTAIYRQVKGCRVEDSLDRLLTAPRLQAACLYLFHCLD